MSKENVLFQVEEDELDRPVQEDEGAGSRKHLIFTVDDLKIGIDAEQVVELLNGYNATYLPMMPDYIQGIFNMRGQIIPIMDIRLRLGKPQDQVDAFTMLSVLSGRTHHVRTGVTLCRGGRVETRAETTAVTFRPLEQDELWGYIRSGAPMDKAGAYGAQGKAALFVSRIEGDYFNVMGLPLYLLGNMLEDFGVHPFSLEEDL